MVRGVALLVFMVTAMSPAHAEPQVDVVVVAAGTANDVFSLRLRAEITSAGFSSRHVSYSAEPLDSLARREFASAAVRPLASGKGVEVWLDERANGRPMVRQHVVDERPLGPDVNMVVLQTTELLRSGLRGLTVAAVPTPVVQTSPTPRQLWSLGAGIGAHKQQGAFSMFPVVRIQAAWAPTSALGAEVSLQGPWNSTRVSSIEGTTKGAPWTAGLGARLTSSRAAVFGELGLGAQWQYWSLQGEPQGAVVANSRNASIFGAYSRGRIAVAVASWLCLGLDLIGSSNFHATAITHARREVGRIDRLAVSGLIVVEATSQ